MEEKRVEVIGLSERSNSTIQYIWNTSSSNKVYFNNPIKYVFSQMDRRNEYGFEKQMQNKVNRNWLNFQNQHARLSIIYSSRDA